MEMAQRQRPTAPPRPDPSPTSVRPEAPPVTRVFATGYVDEASRTALSASGVKVEGFRPDHLEAALSEDAARCALLWQNPVEAAATAMETGRNLNEVTGAWLTNAREVLAVFRRNRRRLLLVDTRLLTPRATEAEREALCSRLQIKTLTIATKEPDGPARQMARMLAGLVLPQIPALRQCLDELEASSLPVAPEIPSVGDLTAAADLFKHIAEQAARVDDLGKENALLKTRAGLQQEEAGHLLEEHRFAGLALEKSLARALADLRTEARSRVKLQEEHDGLREKHRLANLAAEKALARATADLRAGEEARAKLQEERDGLVERLHQIFASTSWRVTRPLRMLKLRLVGGLPPADQALAETIARHPAARNNAADGK